MRALHDQQRSEERELLGAVSAPTTPPHVLDAASAQPVVPGSAGGPPRSRSGNDLGHFPESDRNGAAPGPHASFTHFANNSKSVPGSRRHSGEASKDLDVGSLGLERLGLASDAAQAAAAASVSFLKAPPAALKSSLHRLSLGRSGQRSASHKVAPTSEAASVTSFLFDDEDADLRASTREGLRRRQLNQPALSDAFGGKYLQMNADDDDKFPILVRRDSFPGMVSTPRPPQATDRAEPAPTSSRRRPPRWTSPRR